MRNNRQHKKISKQAMNLLISHYGYQRKSFSLESEMWVRKHREEWHFWTAPCYWYGEQDQYPAVGKLFDEVINEGTDWTKEGPVYIGPPIPDGDVAIIRFVRMKGGA